ncbi:hypothetical protein HYT92_03750 [Candidatus Pacearchaeota archaeon]|nr:hypothetical protein [Candidatus Pacearchaeota archaeon]
MRSSRTLARDAMKHKLSVSLDEKLLQELDSVLSTGRYRNKSHAVEFAVKKLIENQPLIGIQADATQTSPEAKNG